MNCGNELDQGRIYLVIVICLRGVMEGRREEEEEGGRDGRSEGGSVMLI